MKAHQSYWLDPTLAAIIAVVIAVAAINLLTDGIHELSIAH